MVYSPLCTIYPHPKPWLGALLSVEPDNSTCCDLQPCSPWLWLTRTVRHSQLHGRLLRLQVFPEAVAPQLHTLPCGRVGRSVEIHKACNQVACFNVCGAGGPDSKLLLSRLGIYHWVMYKPDKVIFGIDAEPTATLCIAKSGVLKQKQQKFTCVGSEAGSVCPAVIAHEDVGLIHIHSLCKIEPAQ